MTGPVRIPADVDREDRLLGPLTARQVAILAVTGFILLAGWTATKHTVPLPVFLVAAIPIAAVATFVALGQRDGLSLDRLLLAAVRQRLAPRIRVTAPEGIRPVPTWLAGHTVISDGPGPTGTRAAPAALELPAQGVTETGVIDLGTDGLAVVAVASTVNFALRTAQEQESLVAGFGRYLHSLTGPVQILVRTERLDLSGQIAELRDAAGGLPHPALEQAALEHADYLDQLDQTADLLRRQVLLVLHERPQTAAGSAGSSLWTALGLPRTSSDRAGRADDAAKRAAEARLARRLQEAIELLSPAGVVVTPLDAGQSTSLLAAACNPDSLLPSSAQLAAAEDVITTEPGEEGWDHDEVPDSPDWDDDFEEADDL